jgi:hypothetical protein
MRAATSAASSCSQTAGRAKSTASGRSTGPRSGAPSRESSASPCLRSDTRCLNEYQCGAAHVQWGPEPPSVASSVGSMGRPARVSGSGRGRMLSSGNPLNRYRHPPQISPLPPRSRPTFADPRKILLLGPLDAARPGVNTGV